MTTWSAQIKKLDKEYYAELKKLKIDRWSKEASTLWRKKYKTRFKKLK